MNKVILIGNIVNDIELRQTQGGTMTARFRLAVYRSKKDNTNVSDFISCTAFGANAEFISKYFSKGKRIGIEGNLKTGSYDDKDGKKVYTTEVWVEKSEFIEKKGSDQNAAPAAPPPAPSYSQQNYQGQQAPAYSQPDYPDFGYPDYPLPY